MVGSVAFGNGNLAKVKDRGGIVTLGWPKLDEVLYVEGLKENLISISQMCEKDHKLNFHQDLYKVINKKGKVVIIGHRTLDNCYATNSIFRTPLMYSRAKPDSTKLWHKRLGHINYRDLVHLVNTERVRDIPRLSGEPKPICDECMKGKKIKSSHKRYFLGYSTMSKVYRVYNQNSQVIQESSNVVINDTGYDQNIIDNQISTQEQTR
ncbi:hypothetical protein CK203_061227 [Vitis vinifera]|uniref:Uncharacterized protein n=1 Tax=Vitis vinifera TaxID=29760 RepID=A0A438GK45_VITVI|nr:hypothetical protein CK203_061227 [Vitis vinifera]